MFATPSGNITFSRINWYSQFVEDCLRQLLTSLFDGKFTPELSETKINRILKQNNFRFYFITCQKNRRKEVVGMFTVYAIRLPSRSVLMLEEMIILPENRGQGIGKHVLEEVVKIAKAMKCDMVECNVRITNERGLKFYTDFGFIDRGQSALRFYLGEK